MLINLDGQDIAVYTVDNMPYEKIAGDIAYRKGNSKKKRRYYSAFGTFDIETTSLITEVDKNGKYADGIGFMYIWQACLDGYVVMGRTWDDFIIMLQSLRYHFNHIGTDYWFIIYVHNLPFEYQFMHDYIEEVYPEVDIFATQSRKVLTYAIKDLRIEFRCAAKLSGRSLRKYLDDTPGCIYHKKDGDLDYHVIRTSKTELTEKELGYCIVDVLGLWTAIKIDMRLRGFNTATIPLTSTGFVRYALRQRIGKDAAYHKLLSDMAMTPEQYKLVDRLKRGGDTLASLSNPLGTLHKDCLSFDYRSSYPARQCIEDYPMSKFELEEIKSVNDIDTLISENRYFITEFIVKNIELKDTCQPIPAISEYKCDYIAADKQGDVIVYNGRVIYAKELAIAVDRVTWEMINEQYKWETIIFGESYSCRMGKLPKIFTDFVLDTFVDKCNIGDKIDIAKAQGVTDTQDFENLMADYMISKGNLNGIFGMTYTDPLHDEYIKNKDNGWETKEADLNEPKIIKQLYKNQITAVGAYIWGVHTAALGRKALDTLIKKVGIDATIYCDTDSDKAKNLPGVAEKIEEWNVELRQKAIDAGAYVTTDLKTYYLGEVENETKKEHYAEFITLGAKKYAYKMKDGLHITVSGVKKDCVNQLNNDIKNFEKGFLFDPAGGITLHYNDWCAFKTVKVVGDDGVEDTIRLGSNICCTDRKVTLGGITDNRDLRYGEQFADLYELDNVDISSKI